MSSSAEGARQVLDELMASVLGRLGITTSQHTACALLKRIKDLVVGLKSAHKGRFSTEARNVMYGLAAAVAPSNTGDKTIGPSKIEYLIGLNRKIAAVGSVARASVLSGKPAAACEAEVGQNPALLPNPCCGLVAGQHEDE
jgi:hypothetical protein